VVAPAGFEPASWPREAVTRAAARGTYDAVAPGGGHNVLESGRLLSMSTSPEGCAICADASGGRSSVAASRSGEVRGGRGSGAGSP
jgi:hypothetical protein